MRDRATLKEKLEGKSSRNFATTSGEKKKRGKKAYVRWRRYETRELCLAWRGAGRREQAAQNGFLLFRNYRDVGSLGRRWWGVEVAAEPAVGRKFKIEYLASNFHRSSKNHAVSYLAGGTKTSHPPRDEGRRGERTGGGWRGEVKGERLAREKKETDGESSPLFAPRTAEL